MLYSLPSLCTLVYNMCMSEAVSESSSAAYGSMSTASNPDKPGRQKRSTAAAASSASIAGGIII